MSIKISTEPIELRRNREWKNASPKAKRLFYENLPFPFPIVMGILLLLYFIPYAITTYFFPRFEYIGAVQMSLVSIYILYLARSLIINYKKKTGRDLNEDTINAQNKYDLK